MYECFTFMYVCVPYACLVPMEIRKGYQDSWNWSSRWLLTIRLVLGTQSSPKATNNKCSQPLSHLSSHFCFIKVWSWVCILYHMCIADALGGRKRASQSPKLELQVVVKPSDRSVGKGTQVSLQDNWVASIMTPSLWLFKFLQFFFYIFITEFPFNCIVSTLLQCLSSNFY